MGDLSRFLYVVRMDVDPAEEKRFNEWYDEEHLPALLKVPGVLGAYRYVSLEGEPKYVAVYELERADVPSGEAWKRAAAETPRPKEVVTRNVTRNLYQRIYPER